MTHSLVTKALKALPKKAPALQKKILEELGQQIVKDDIPLFDENLLIEMAASHWDLAKKRDFAEPKMKLYCPVVKGAAQRKTIIDIVSDDFAFLLDSVIAEINKNNLLIDLLLHPTVYAQYDKKGNLKAIHHDEVDGSLRQSHIHIHIKEALSEEALASLETGLYTALEDVYYANRDWRAMLAKLDETADMLANAKTRRPAKEIEKYCAFLKYLHNNNFTLLAYREYEFTGKDKTLKSRTVRGSSLGLLSTEVKPAYISEAKEGLPRNLQEMRKNLPPVSISKTNRLATVHRRVPMDAIAVKMYDDKGEVTGERLFLGLFTSVTYSRSVNDVPYLREKVQEVVENSGFYQGSHERKALRHILEKYPRDELFQIRPKDLSKIAKNILRLSERQRIALFMRPDPFGRYVSSLVYIPRDRFGTKLRKEIGVILEQELNGEISDFYVNMDDSVFARVMFTINVSQKAPANASAEDIEDKLQEAGKTWQEILAEALNDSLDDENEVTALTFKYGDAFPVAYTSHYQARQAVFDIGKIETVLSSGQIQLDLYRPENMDQSRFRLKIYNPGSPITLSDVLPILENFGLRVIAELPFEINPEDAKEGIWIHDFLLERPARHGTIHIKDVKPHFEKAFTKIWYNSLENDGLNRLVLTAALNWHETTILRSYIRYLKQLRFPFSRAYVEAALYKNPKIAHMIVDLFKAFHNPENGKNADDLAAKCASSIDRALEAVDSLDEDRILRAFVNLVETTLRTNYFQRQEDGSAKPYLSMKLDCQTIKDMPLPAPYRETFVYSPRVEALHLRGDKIARGGLRWSDRREDFRTEVLGLMKAQMVKNSVIVPMGAKGGFVVKTKGLSRDEFRVEGVECYKILIRGLLDICDNRKGDKIIPPKGVVRRDGDDPYLVVAADKGTATFSDIANGLSQDYGFWLDDAFASGGSAGYDHKKMGITARGAWESVKAHFRQLNHNIQAQEFDVIGVGDMGGDVFGNGMLLSEHIRLVGAFNHLHIVCDPDPDAKSSFKERKRLFDGVKGWADYNTKLLSKGGMIYSRADKTLKLTPEIKARFDLPKDKVTPNELMKAILTSRSDLLWFGGIGTYIKSCKESDEDVGDKANDAIRIDAEELNAKVIGEGANLGVTQLGRIELAERGCKMNTDFVDNSGGVDSSDHEVNIKILLTEVVADKTYKMDIKKRNKLLEKMTEEVAEHVLRNNYQQAQAISLAELQARETLQIQNEFIQDLQRDIGLDRKIEGLPDEETVDLRMRLGKGMTRPELCVLLSYAKITFTNDLLASDIPDSAEMQNWLTDYFPTPLQKTYHKEIKNHRLAREIIATTMANSLVNRMGPTFIKSRMNKTSASTADIARAYIVVREAFGLRQIWDEIEALDNKVPAEVQMKAMRETALLAEHAITWFLTRFGRDLDIGRDCGVFSKGVADLRQNLDGLVTDNLRATIKQRADAGVRDGLPKDLSHTIALMPVMSSACDMINIADSRGMNLSDIASTYFELGEHFHLDWLRSQARYLSADNHWESEAISGLVDQLFGSQAGLTVRVLQDTNAKAKKGQTLAESWFADHAHKLSQLEPLFAELRRVGTVDLAMLITAEQRLRQLYGG
jgi:glutamate dehydrogenase